MDIEAQIDGLYGVALEDFTPARNALAKRLRSEGSKADADRVAKLPKPVVAAWAVNQAARRDRSTYDRLLDVGRRTEEVEDAAALRSLAGDKRSAIMALAAHARDALSEAGKPASAATREAITRTFSALPALHSDPDVERARLSREVEATGLEGLAAGAFGWALPEEPAEVPEEQRRAALVAEAEALERRAAELEEAAADARQEADRAKERAARARGEALRARRQAGAEAG